MPGDPASLLHRYADLHNECVRTGAREQLVALFAPDAELTFEGIDFPTQRGRAAIDAAFRDHAPDDELVLRCVRVEDGEAVGAYEWRSKPGRSAGALRLRARDGAIVGLVVVAH